MFKKHALQVTMVNTKKTPVVETPATSIVEEILTPEVQKLAMKVGLATIGTILGAVTIRVLGDIAIAKIESL